MVPWLLKLWGLALLMSEAELALTPKYLRDGESCAPVSCSGVGTIPLGFELKANEANLEHFIFQRQHGRMT